MSNMSAIGLIRCFTVLWREASVRQIGQVRLNPRWIRVNVSEVIVEVRQLTPTDQAANN
jgi:hypothetical protein